MSRKTILVIFCYNRPEASKARIKQLRNVNCPVMVSIDAQKSGIPLKDFDTLENEFSPNVTFAKNQKNQGLVMHFVTRMSELFVNYDNIIVIEDDVSVEKSTINYLIEILQERLPQDILSVGLFGFLPGKLMSRFGCNRWRKTKYFSAWGFAMQREDWNSFNLEIEHELSKLETSKTWTKMSDREKAIWNHRFLRVIHNHQFTWDTQMNFAGFCQEKKQLLPLFRLADNEGFNDARATNTSGRRPRWYKGIRGSINVIDKSSCNYEFRTVPKLLSQILEFFDAITWAGTRRFPKVFRK